MEYLLLTGAFGLILFLQRDTARLQDRVERLEKLERRRQTGIG